MPTWGWVAVGLSYVPAWREAFRELNGAGSGSYCWGELVADLLISFMLGLMGYFLIAGRVLRSTLGHQRPRRIADWIARERPIRGRIGTR